MITTSGEPFTMYPLFILIGALTAISNAAIAEEPWHGREVDLRATQIEGAVINWRRDIHQNPELGNREFRTASLIANHPRVLISVQC